MTNSELLDAVSKGDLPRVERMLHPDTDLNPAEGTTPLYQAAVKGDHEMARLLLEYGADPNQASGDPDEGLPLCAAACWDHWETVQALVDGGADPGAREDDGWTPLLWAASHGHLTSGDILLDAGASPGSANDSGLTPLTAAARFGAYGLVWSLLEHGADPALPGAGGETALDIARRMAGEDVEAVLREEVTAQAGGDWTILVSRSHAGDGTQLISVEARDPDGATGFGISRQRGHAAVATCLEDAMGIRTPPEELIARATPYRDVDEEGETWWAAVHALQKRHDDETFEAMARMCETGRPVEREFAVDVLAQFGYDAEHRPYRDRSLPILRRMAVTEREPDVIESLLSALGHHADERALDEVLSIVNRPDRTPSTRDPVALAAVLPPDHEEGLAALIRLSECAKPDVRDWATMSLASLDCDTAPVREALVRRLADEDLETVAEAAQGLAARGDRRAIDGIHRVLSEADAGHDYARDVALEAAQELGLEITGA